MKETFHCNDCRTDYPIRREDGTGYAVVGKDEAGAEIRVCYECCAARDREHMRQHGTMVLYLVQKRVICGPDKQTRGGTWEITNWPGTLRIFVSHLKKGRHNIAGSRYDAWFKFDGHWWWGEIIRCKRTKTPVQE